MGKRFVSAAIIAGLTLGFITLAAPSAGALTDLEQCFVNKMNEERAAVGRPALSVASDLTTIARRHSQRMADDATIYHNHNYANEVEGNWTALGENVGMGPDCKSIHDAFMASAGHRANILDTDFNQVGVGVVFKDDTVYVTEDFAGRKSSTTTTTRRTTTTTRKATTKPAAKPVAKPATPPAPPPPPPPPPPVAQPRTVDFLVQLLGMDAPRVDPATGAAMGI